MITPELISYIKSQLAVGQTSENIISILEKQGWINADIQEAFSNVNGVVPGNLLNSNLPGTASAGKGIFVLKVFGWIFGILFFGGIGLSGYIVYGLVFNHNAITVPYCRMITSDIFGKWDYSGDPVRREKNYKDCLCDIDIFFSEIKNGSSPKKLMQALFNTAFNRYMNEFGSSSDEFGNCNPNETAESKLMTDALGLKEQIYDPLDTLAPKTLNFSTTSGDTNQNIQTLIEKLPSNISLKCEDILSQTFLNQTFRDTSFKISGELYNNGLACNLNGAGSKKIFPSYGISFSLFPNNAGLYESTLDLSKTGPAYNGLIVKTNTIGSKSYEVGPITNPVIGKLYQQSAIVYFATSDNKYFITVIVSIQDSDSVDAMSYARVIAQKISSKYDKLDTLAPGTSNSSTTSDGTNQNLPPLNPVIPTNPANISDFSQYTFPDFSEFDDIFVPINVPLLNQNDPTNGSLGKTACGSTALAMVASFYGIDASVPDLIKITGTDANGSTLENLSKAAKQVGLSGTIMNDGFVDKVADLFTNGSHSLDALTKEVSNGNPVIVNVEDSQYPDGHALVITGVSDDKVYVNNPSGGKTEVIGKTEFVAMWGEKGYGYMVPKK